MRVRAKRKTLDGIKFASTAEANRYGELKLMVAAKIIDSLVCHPKFDLRVNGFSVCKYTPDFQYWDCAVSRWIIEEVKGGYVKAGMNRDYPIRRDLFKALNPCFVFREIKA